MQVRSAYARGGGVAVPDVRACQHAACQIYIYIYISNFQLDAGAVGVRGGGAALPELGAREQTACPRGRPWSLQSLENIYNSTSDVYKATSNV